MNSCQVTADLEQLWRRVVFNICTSNTDDHLRNHGFLLTSKGWKLSPAYDLNPVETSNGLTLNITENNNALDLALALKTAPFYRISNQKALQIISEMKAQIKNWRKIAKKYGLSRQEQEVKARAFRVGCEE
jgi:serine/threonine-protein kinase HipA